MLINVKEGGEFIFAVKDHLGKVLEGEKGTDQASIGNTIPSGIHILHLQSSQGAKRLN